MSSRRRAGRIVPVVALVQPSCWPCSRDDRTTGRWAVGLLFTGTHAAVWSTLLVSCRSSATARLSTVGNKRILGMALACYGAALALMLFANLHADLRPADARPKD